MLRDAFENTAHNHKSAAAHEKLAYEYLKLGRSMPAVAEFRTSMALSGMPCSCADSMSNSVSGGGLSSAACIKGDYSAIISQLTKSHDALAYSHNTYYRLKTISGHLAALYGRDDFSMLDIGGGEGDLCLFLPKAGYVLAEPEINGISGQRLDFDNKSFDCVVAVHVLEHIPKALREAFLDRLCEKAKQHVILLNPFKSESSNLIEKLAYELTGEEWAKEHIECNLPQIEEIGRYAADRNLKCSIIPNGSQVLTAAVAFLDYFARLAQRPMEWIKVNQLLNGYKPNVIDNSNLPNAWLVELDVRT